jgi:hypothetical protein
LLVTVCPDGQLHCLHAIPAKIAFFDLSFPGFLKQKKPGKWPKAFCAEKGASMSKKSHAAPAGKSENPSCIVMSACSTATQHETENCAEHAKIAPPASYIDSPDPRSSHRAETFWKALYPGGQQQKCLSWPWENPAAEPFYPGLGAKPSHIKGIQFTGWCC